MPKPRTRKRLQPVKGNLRAFAEARKSNISILNDVRTHVVASSAGDSGREAHKIHVSELVKDDACPRRMYYKLTEVDPTDQPKAAYHRLEMIWAAGHAEHAKWQRWLREMGVLYGTWRCLVCKNEWEDTSPEGCPMCDSGLLEYREVNLEDPEYPLVGHADGAVPDRECLIEIKSFSVGTVRIENPNLVKKHTHKVDGKSIIDHEAIWQSIKRPLKSHLRQGLIYLWMCERMALPFKSIVFIYENKTTQDTKAFEVKLTHRLTDQFVETLEEVTSATEAPDRPRGFTKELRPCNECQFRTECWSDDDTSTTSTRVSSRRSRSRSQEDGGEAAVRPATPTRGEDPEGPRRRHRTGQSRVHDADDGDDPVGRASVRSTRNGRGGRAVGRSSDGQGEGTRVPRTRSRRD